MYRWKRWRATNMVMYVKSFKLNINSENYKKFEKYQVLFESTCHDLYLTPTPSPHLPTLICVYPPCT